MLRLMMILVLMMMIYLSTSSCVYVSVALWLKSWCLQLLRSAHSPLGSLPPFQRAT